MTLLYRFAALAMLALAPQMASAVSESDLLPVDKAFTLSADAPRRDTLELTWKVAPGYYLYRQRISVKAEGDGFKPGALTLPSGERKHDPYFGEVETYHHDIKAIQAGTADDHAKSVTLKVRYQGCADAGVCYPPQTRELHVALPAVSADTDQGNDSPGSSVGLPTSDGPGAVSAALQAAAGGSVDKLPLPAAQAFQFEAIVGDGNTLLLRFTPAPGYYLYRDRTSLALEGANGIRTGMPKWPAGQTRHDEHFGDVVVYFDQTEVSLPLLRERKDPAQATLVATFQGCQTDGICYPPMTRRVKLQLPAGKITPANQAAVSPLPIPPLSSSASKSADAKQKADSDAQLQNAADPGRSLPPAQKHNLIAVLLLALLGGLILNLMPCVLPILSLKVMGLAHSGESRARARSHAVWYTLGVLLSFAAIGGTALGLRAAGQAAGWGFQLQQPWFVATLVYLMMVVGMSMTGVFTLGTSLGGVGQSLATRRGPAGDFFTGVLACVVASPCIAPFMGTALAYAFTAPPALAMLVFLFLALGLALPFLLIGFVPSLAGKLPSPGPWMETLKQVLAFPMYLTAIWLLWILGKQRGVDAMALLLVGTTLLALGLWWFERARWNSRRIGMVLASVLVLAALVPIAMVNRIEPPTTTPQAGEVTYSPEMLDRLRADNRVVFVNVTADWCVTCKANEKNVLASDEFRDNLRRVDGVMMTGDWTNVDPQLSAFLDKHQAVGVPLYVVYGPGAPPTVLPTILTQAMVEDALLRAAR